MLVTALNKQINTKFVDTRFFKLRLSFPGRRCTLHTEPSFTERLYEKSCPWQRSQEIGPPGFTLRRDTT